MIRFVASIYRALITLLAGALMLGVVTCGFLMLWFERGDRLVAVGLILIGPFVVVLVFGTLAILVQNNELLHRIADAQSPRKPGRLARGREANRAEEQERSEPRLRS